MPQTSIGFSDGLSDAFASIASPSPDILMGYAIFAGIGALSGLILSRTNNKPLQSIIGGALIGLCAYQGIGFAVNGLAAVDYWGVGEQGASYLAGHASFKAVTVGITGAVGVSVLRHK
jgi:hypothetical protein